MERLRDDFIATLTHDLRTPLLAAIQTLQFFLDGTLGVVEEKQRMLLDTMKKKQRGYARSCQCTVRSIQV